METSENSPIPSLETQFSFTPLYPGTNNIILKIHEQTGTISHELKKKILPQIKIMKQKTKQKTPSDVPIPNTIPNTFPLKNSILRRTK